MTRNTHGYTKTTTNGDNRTISQSMLSFASFTVTGGRAEARSGPGADRGSQRDVTQQRGPWGPGIAGQ